MCSGSSFWMRTKTWTTALVAKRHSFPLNAKKNLRKSRKFRSRVFTLWKASMTIEWPRYYNVKI